MGRAPTQLTVYVSSKLLNTSLRLVNSSLTLDSSVNSAAQDFYGRITRPFFSAPMTKRKKVWQCETTPTANSYSYCIVHTYKPKISAIIVYVQQIANYVILSIQLYRGGSRNGGQLSYDGITI